MIEFYPDIKWVHVCAVIASGILFAVRGAARLAGAQWVMAAELVETSQLLARTVAKIDPAWIERAAGDLCKRSYGDPHWEQRAGHAVARQQVSLYGLPIVKNRSVSYAEIDPVASRDDVQAHRVQVPISVHFVILVSQCGFSDEIAPAPPKPIVNCYLTAGEGLPTNVHAPPYTEVRRKKEELRSRTVACRLDDRDKDCG